MFAGGSRKGRGEFIAQVPEQRARAKERNAGTADMIANAAQHWSAEPVTIKQWDEHAKIFRPDVQLGDDD